MATADMTARRANRVDANHTAVALAFRRLGCSVQSMAELGSGVPDLLVAIDRRHTFCVEVKDGAKPPSKRALTPDQVDWHAAWRGAVYVVESEEDAIRVVMGYRGRDA